MSWGLEERKGGNRRGEMKWYILTSPFSTLSDSFYYPRFYISASHSGSLFLRLYCTVGVDSRLFDSHGQH